MDPDHINELSIHRGEGGIRECHAVILRDRVVPASQVPFLGMGPDEPGQLCTEEMTARDSFSHP